MWKAVVAGTTLLSIAGPTLPTPSNRLEAIARG